MGYWSFIGLFFGFMPGFVKNYVKWKQEMTGTLLPDNIDSRMILGAYNYTIIVKL